MISLENVHKSYGQQEVLKAINLQIQKGDVLVICGPSGSGKSTLAKTINGLEAIQRGAITVDGQNIKDMTAMALHMRVGMVFQDFALFANKNVLDNLVVPQVQVLRMSAQEARTEAFKLLETVGMDSHAHKYPSQLSGGQQQRVAIARALALKPDYLVFDEPTSALDPEKVAEALKLIGDVAAKGMTMVVVTHEMGFARKVSNRVVFMNDGCIEEDALTEDFFTAPQSKRAQEFLEQIIR